uniref:Uncharacterized protein n=1 Tax=Rhodnius prolixus TaxID=13249 RepID=T1I685_RHOPR
MALQEVVCNGIKTDNIQTNGVHNILPKYEKIRDGKETDGINIQEKSEVEDFKTDANHVATNKEQNTEVLVNNSEENKGKNDLAHLLDESIDVFSASFLTSDIIVNTAQGNDIKAEKVSALATKEQENLKEHDCLVHPTHLSLVNKLEASKNTISNLEDTIHRLEKQLSEESTKTEKIVQLETSIFQYEKEVQLCKQEHEIDQRTITTLQKEMEAKLLAASELSNAYKEIDKLKEEINSRDIKIKWTQNKLISEMEAHKECPLIIERLNSNIKTLENEMDVCRKEINNLKLQLEQNNIIGSTTKEQGSRVFIENQENKTLHSEDQTLVKENSLISQQVENIKQILLGLYSSSNSLSDSASGLDFNISGKRESLIKQLKEIEHILSEVGLLSCDSENKYCTRHPNSSELLSLPNLKMSENEVQPHSIVLRHEDVKDLGNTGDNEVLMAHLKNRIEDLESQLAEEKLARENNEKNITRAEQILSEVDLLRSTNEELMTDILACKSREAELLAFTQKLTSKNVELQSEFSAVESKADELEKIEKSHAASELQRKSEIEQLHRNLAEEKERRLEDTRLLARQVAEKTTKMENLLETVNTLQSELSLVKNKHVVQIKELQRELSQYKRKIEQLELLTGGTGSSTNSVTSGSKSTTSSLSSLNDSPVLQGIDVPAQILVERIVKLQQESAKQNDRIEFLEEHTAQLVKELQKKSRLLQNYILREQAGTLTSNSMDRSKAELSKSGGIMASLYGNKPADETMTFELCLEINRKLQAVLEDTLLKNITLKENIDTLGDEIARLSQQK